MDEYQIAINNLERLRSHVGLTKKEIDNILKRGEGKYGRIINGQALELQDLIAIAGLYSLNAAQALNPALKMPSLARLPDNIRLLTKNRIGKSFRTQEKIDLIPHLVIILDKHFKVNDTFLNANIKQYLPFFLQNKTIEWNKSNLSPFIQDTGETHPGKTKPEKVYKLIEKIPSSMVENAKEIVGINWLVV